MNLKISFITNLMINNLIQLQNIIALVIYQKLEKLLNR
jgi:hypothetical protein